jgi:hypothetical protein
MGTVVEAASIDPIASSISSQPSNQMELSVHPPANESVIVQVQPSFDFADEKLSESDEEDEVANEAAYHARRRGLSSVDELDRDEDGMCQCNTRHLARWFIALVTIILMLGVIYIERTHDGGVKGLFVDADESSSPVSAAPHIDPPAETPVETPIEANPSKSGSPDDSQPPSTLPRMHVGPPIVKAPPQGIAVGEPHPAAPVHFNEPVVKLIGKRKPQPPPTADAYAAESDAEELASTSASIPSSYVNPESV